MQIMAKQNGKGLEKTENNQQGTITVFIIVDN